MSKIYECPNCNVGSTEEKWDLATVEEYGDGGIEYITFIGEKDKDACVYKCPSCNDVDINGEDIEEVKK